MSEECFICGELADNLADNLVGHLTHAHMRRFADRHDAFLCWCGMWFLGRGGKDHDLWLSHCGEQGGSPAGHYLACKLKGDP